MGNKINNCTIYEKILQKIFKKKKWDKVIIILKILYNLSNIAGIAWSI